MGSDECRVVARCDHKLEDLPAKISQGVKLKTSIRIGILQIMYDVHDLCSVYDHYPYRSFSLVLASSFSLIL